MTKLKFTKKQTELLDKALETHQLQESRKNLTAKQQRVFVASQMTSADLLGPKRLEGEDFEEYKERRTIENLWYKMQSQGKFVWVSTSWREEPATGMYINEGGGTYIKAIHGEL